jgi:hypothetical protein
VKWGVTGPQKVQLRVVFLHMLLDTNQRDMSTCIHTKICTPYSIIPGTQKVKLAKGLSANEWLNK